MSASKQRGLAAILAVTLAALACLTILAACTALVVGGAASGGYSVDEGDRPAGPAVDDRAITDAVKSRLLADDMVKRLGLTVSTHNGVVTLAGRAGSYVEKQRAEQIARSVAGVVSVSNELQVGAGT